jgi:hypothetical protein
MKNGFAGNCLSRFRVPTALAGHHATNRLPASSNCGTQISAEIETAAFAQRAGTLKMKHGLRGRQVCPIEKTMSPGNNFVIKIEKIYLESF